MTVRLVFLGKLADVAGGGVLEVHDTSGRSDWADLLAVIADWRSSDLADAVRAETVKVAVNGVLLADKTALSVRDGDEVAFLPPVSGG